MKMIQKICENCKKEFLIDSYFKDQKCCSKKCSYQNQSLKKEYELICKCGKTYKVFVTKHKLKIGDHKKSCSLKCSKSRNWSNEQKEKISKSKDKGSIPFTRSNL
jgi:hypothetical protein